MPKSHRPKGPSQRMLRVGELVRHALAEFLQRGEITDPALERATITVPEVRMTPDLKLANVYVVPLGGENAEQVVKALNVHHRFIRGQLGPRLDLKFTPEFRFFVDETFDEADRIERLLRSERVQKDLRAEDEDEDDDRDEAD